jgi:hypothetical protein
MLGCKIEPGMRVRNLAFLRPVPHGTMGTVLNPVYEGSQFGLVGVRWDTGETACVFQWELQEVKSGATV